MMIRSAAAVVLTAALVSCAGGNGAKNASSSASVAHVGNPAPDWSESTVPSGTLSLASLRGKAVYLNFFATWCPPCNEEAPAINSLQQRYGSRGLQVVGIDMLENARKAEEFRSEHHLVYPAVVDDGTLRDQYNVNGLPVHVFIDRRGIVRNIIIGELSPTEMRTNVERILR